MLSAIRELLNQTLFKPVIVPFPFNRPPRMMSPRPLPTFPILPNTVKLPEVFI